MIPIYIIDVFLAVLIEWETDNLSIMENISVTSLCASVVNPQLNIPVFIEVEVISTSITATGIIVMNKPLSVIKLRMFTYFNTAGEDYIPITELLSFMVVTGDRQCINISLIDDNVLEDDDVFLVEARNNSFITTVQPFVEVVVLNEDSKSCSNHMKRMHECDV